ncbi:hypothetical protein BW155_11900, partial [Lactococcus lactis subsp. lactis]
KFISYKSDRTPSKHWNKREKNSLHVYIYLFKIVFLLKKISISLFYSFFWKKQEIKEYIRFITIQVNLFSFFD